MNIIPPSTDPLEAFWDALLSREPERARAVFLQLDKETRHAVVAHLIKMTCEEGWHPEQVLSAQAALDAIQELLK